MRVWSLGGEALLEKEMATHFSKNRQVSITSTHTLPFELRVSKGSPQYNSLPNFPPYVKRLFFPFFPM